MYALKLKDIRENNDLKQIDVANFLKVSQPIYAMWENQDKIIPLKRLRDLCNYFGFSMDYIFNLTDTNNFHYLEELNNVTIGKNIIKLRKKYNIKQFELANLLNTTRSTICAYEKGKTLILTAFLYQICKHFKVSMDEMCNSQNPHFY